MDIFLSWSGARSKRVAQALQYWLPVVLDDVDPWFSDKDIQAGERWSLEVGQRLETTNFGIICLTRDNLQSPWILFEAGALSKALGEGHVCPYLLDIELKELTGPLSQFQAKRTEKTSTLELLQSINNKGSKPIDASRLKQRFEGLWPDFKQELNEIPTDQEVQSPTRPTDEILEELVQIVRATDRRLGELDIRLVRFERLAAKGGTPVVSQGAAPATLAGWDRVMEHLRQNHQAPAAAVYEEADVTFDGNVLLVSYPEELSIYVNLCQHNRHAAPLLDAVEAVYGIRPTELLCEARTTYVPLNQIPDS
jgi:hypothetical protein